MTDFTVARTEMVERQILARGISDPLVLAAMRSVPRELFLPPRERDRAYQDTPLPIGADQTISQPYIVAFMVASLELKGGEKVLEIGTGSAYAAAILSKIAAQVYTVERVAALAQQAVKTLSSLEYQNVMVLHADGTHGWPEHAPFDGIIVSAGGPRVPETLKSQLKIGGSMVIPIGSDRRQQLVRVTRQSETEFTTKSIAEVRFVPLIGDEGWES